MRGSEASLSRWIAAVPDFRAQGFDEHYVSILRFSSIDFPVAKGMGRDITLNNVDGICYIADTPCLRHLLHSCSLKKIFEGLLARSPQLLLPISAL